MTGSRSVELCHGASSTQRVGSILDVVYDQVPADSAQVEIDVIIFRMFEHAAGIDFALARASPIDNSLFELMVPVSPKHVALPVMGHATLHVPEKLRGEELRRDREPLSLASHVGSARLRLQDNLRLEEVQRLPERCGRTVCEKLRKEIHAVADAGLIHRGEVVMVTHPYYTVSERMNPPRVFTALLILFGNFPPSLASARDDDANLFPQFPGGNRRLVPIANFAVGPGGNDRRKGNHTETTVV